MVDRKMRYTENEVDGRYENGVDGDNRNRGFATWGEIDITYLQVRKSVFRGKCFVSIKTA